MDLLRGQTASLAAGPAAVNAAHRSEVTRL